MTATPSMRYEQVFQSFGLKENPFRASFDFRLLFLGRSYEATLAELMFGLESRSGLLVLTGEPGTGKTLLLRRLLQWLGQRKHSTAYIFHSHLPTAALFGFIAQDFGIPAESWKKTELLAAIQKWLQARQAEGDSPVIFIDEAQALSTRALSELCLLLNLENSAGKLVQILLAGQNELDEKLHQPELRQLRQRIAVRSRLPLLSLEETEEYIAARLHSAGAQKQTIFAPGTVQALYAYAQGTPRVVNMLCEKSMLAAYAERKTVVSVANVRRAASELDFNVAPIAASAAELSPLPNVDWPPEGRDLLAKTDTDASPPAPRREEVAIEPAAVRQLSPETPNIPPEPRPKPNVRVFVTKPVVPELKQPPVPETQANPARPIPPTTPQRPRPRNAFRGYWSEVVNSFVRDCKYFLAAFRTQSARDGKVLFMKKYDLHRDLVAPVSRWLSKPVSFKGSAGRARDSERRASHGH